MANVSLKTDYWIETDLPISNLLTDEWSFFLTSHPSLILKTDLWASYYVPFTPLYYPQNVFLSFATIGDVQLFNIDKTDNGNPIYFELETQEINFTDRGHLKKISDKMAVLTNNAQNSVIECDTGNGYEPVPMDLSKRVNLNKNIDLEGNYFTFKWSGESSTASPVFEGFQLESITDLGITKS